MPTVNLEDLVQNMSCGKFDRCDVSIDPDSDQAANAARQISGSVVLRPPSLPILNCSFLIFSAKFDTSDHNVRRLKAL